MNALLLSASKEGNTEYLEHALPLIADFLGDNVIKNAIFIPFAGVTISYDDYTQKVKDALVDLPVDITGIHQHENYQHAIASADLIIVGGGNTFELLNQLYQHELINVIKTAVENGCAYIGWSAGSNIAGQSIKTTNDMPIVQPESFDALNLLPIQLNPHYTDYQPPGHHGETRQMRIEEFMMVNPNTTVIGIQEGTALALQDGALRLIGSKPGYLFSNGDKTEISSSNNLSHILS